MPTSENYSTHPGEQSTREGPELNKPRPFPVFVGLPGTLVLDEAIAWMGLTILIGRAEASATGPARAH